MIYLSKYQCVFISLTNLNLIKLMFVSLLLVLCCVSLLLQMSRRSSKGKEIVIDVPSPVAKQTRCTSQSPQDSKSERLRTPFDSQTYSSIFVHAPTIVERVVQFDTLGTTFIPRIFEARDWADLFGNFEDPVDKLAKEFYYNTRCTRVELKCWVRGTEFSPLI